MSQVAPYSPKAKIENFTSKDENIEIKKEMVKLEEIRDIKVVLVGDGTVGKTCLLIRYCENKYTSKYLPTIFDNKVAKVRYNDQMIGMNLWDTAGQEDYDTLRPLSYQETDVFILCFDVMNPTSFKNVSLKWQEEVVQYSESANLVLCATKSDLRDSPSHLKELEMKEQVPVTTEEAEKLKKEMGAYSFIETSAKARINIDELFLLCLDSCFKVEPETEKPSGGGGTKNGGGEDGGKKKGGCSIL